ncbi:MAG: hypothetical protein H7X77_03340 [Anaerolineae bacterium]|nr:hypothetical protein [Anaerolineae bacterium]
MSTPTLTYLRSIPLLYTGDCGLLAVTPELNILVEEVYTEDAWIAQHVFSFAGELLHSVDEKAGANKDLQPLAIPEGSSTPRTAWHTMKKLNFSGPRHRGTRESERINDMVQPLAVQEKIALIKRLDLNIAPMLLLGLAESYVLAEAEIQRPYLYIVCRRIRLAYVLAEPARDADRQLYDYDTLVVYLAHWVDRRSDHEPALIDLINSLPGVELYRPMDCLIHNDYLFIADGGGANRTSQIHIWQIQRPVDRSDA